MDSNKEQANAFRWAARAAAAPLRDDKRDYPILPKPEVVLLLDTTGHILRASARYPGDRLGKITFERGRSAHDVLHPGCDGTDCRFTRNWQSAWASHKSGLPVEWPFSSRAYGLDFTLRLQAVSYACSVLFGDAVHSYEDCSVLFIQDNALNETASSRG